MNSLFVNFDEGEDHLKPAVVLERAELREVQLHVVC